MTPDIPLDQARALIERANDKAEQLGLSSSGCAAVTALVNGLEQSWV